MPETPEVRSKTRIRILQAALAEFEANGFHATSVRQIAERVGISKAAVLYHFAGKEQLLDELAEPLLSAMEATVAAAQVGPPGAARWAVVSGILEVYLAHRSLLRVNMLDLALSSGQVFERFKAAMMTANALVAGPSPGPRDLIRAAQAISALGDPVVLHHRLPVDLVREETLAGIRRLLDEAPARPPSRRGRKPALSAAAVKTARRLLEQGRAADDVARQLKVSRATLYRHLQRG